MILESIVTTVGPGGELNVAPMGPVVDAGLTRFRLRPFQTSTTFRNLQAHPEGVIHVVDDVLLIARGAIGALAEPPTRPAEIVRGRVLQDACRSFEFRVVSCDASQPRSEIAVEIVHTATHRDFWGFNRAKHAVLEAAILATRLHLLPAEEIQAEFRRLEAPVEKTAGPRELEAFALLQEYVARHLASPPAR
ncbi:MAG: DUF447 domain-containing protein [Planctomycetaceae bacterium]|jgi:hypothetical protein